MNCKKAKKLFLIYSNGGLKGEQKKEFEEHIRICDSCRKELDLILSFNRDIVFENLKTNPEVDFKLTEKISSLKKNKISFFFKKILYPLIFTIGLLIGIFLGISLSNREENKTFTILKESTFHMEPYLENIKIEEVLNEGK